MLSFLRQQYHRHFIIRPDPSHYLALDGWRGICAVMVALFHFRAFSHLSDWAFIKAGGLFLDFFFVLSGFVIFANYYERLKAGFTLSKFMWLRLGRLYPLHLFTLGLFLLEDAIRFCVPFLRVGDEFPPFEGPYEGLRYIMANLFMLHSTGVTDNLSYNSPSWSISAEFYTYLLYGLLIVLSRGNRLVIYITTFIMFVHMCLVPDHMTGTSNLGILRCIYGFGLGGITWFLFERWKDDFIRIKTQSFSLIEMALFMGVISYMQLIYHYYNTHQSLLVFSPVLFAATVFLFAFQKGFVSKILMNRFFALLGVLSYSIYMTHMLISSKAFFILGLAYTRLTQRDFYTIIDGYKTIGTNLWMGDFAYILYIAMVICFSCLTYLFIEVPGRNWFRKKAGRSEA